jgi:hypothetical protein
MATRQVQVVTISRLAAVIVTAAVVVGLMAILWVFGAQTTGRAIGWMWWALTGTEMAGNFWVVFPMAFSLVEVAKWYFKDALGDTLRYIASFIESFDWLTTAVGLFLIGTLAVQRVLTGPSAPPAPLAWWHYLLLVLAAIGVGHVVTFRPERAAVDAVKNVVEEIEHFRRAS